MIPVSIALKSGQADGFSTDQEFCFFEYTSSQSFFAQHVLVFGSSDVFKKIPLPELPVVHLLAVVDQLENIQSRLDLRRSERKLLIHLLLDPWQAHSLIHVHVGDVRSEGIPVACFARIPVSKADFHFGNETFPSTTSRRLSNEVRRQDGTSVETINDLIALQCSHPLGRMNKRGQQEACDSNVARPRLRPIIILVTCISPHPKDPYIKNVALQVGVYQLSRVMKFHDHQGPFLALCKSVEVKCRVVEERA